MSDKKWITPQELVITHEIAMSVALDSGYPKEVIARYLDMVAEQTVPAPCPACAGVGYVRVAPDSEDVCKACDGRGDKDGVYDLHNYDMTVYEHMLTIHDPDCSTCKGKGTYIEGVHPGYSWTERCGCTLP